MCLATIGFDSSYGQTLVSLITTSSPALRPIQHSIVRVRRFLFAGANRRDSEDDNPAQVPKLRMQGILHSVRKMSAWTATTEYTCLLLFVFLPSHFQRHDSKQTYMNGKHSSNFIFPLHSPLFVSAITFVRD